MKRSVPSMLASLVPHAVTPWLYASTANRARENVWRLFKDMALFETVEPTPHRDTPFRETVFVSSFLHLI